MRLAVYAGASVALAAGVVLKALHQRANFYAACVYLAQSNANLMVLTNLVLLTVCIFMLGLQKLLYGPLRPVETEQLYEKAWFAVTETCLAMTIFRGEVGGWFLVMFVSLIMGKVWGWIGEGRVEILEQQPPASPRLFHTRLAISLTLSVLFDTYMLDYCIKTVLLQARPDMMVMFGFEFAILSIVSTSTAARYAISLVEIYTVQKQKRAKLEERRRELQAAREEAVRQQEQSGTEGSMAGPPVQEDVEEMELDVPGWEEKGRWVFYLDLVTDFLKLIVYLSFFTILLTFYGIPIHIMRDVFMTIRSFFKRITDFVRYRNATRDMNERYPDATAEETAREDVCIICREEMRPWQQPNAAQAGAGQGDANTQRPANPMAERMRPKKLPCGHILHFACLRSWLERQQNCPTCRRPVVGPTIRVGTANPQALNNAAGQMGLQPPLQQEPGGNQAQGVNGQANEGVNRARIVNFGPFRIGFGAGRGNLFQDFAQQIHDGQGRDQIRQNPNGAGPQQIGFRFGFGRALAQQAPAPSAQPSSTDLQGQIRQIEQHLMQEINNLRSTADQLHIVRLLQGELARLRIAQANPGMAGVAGQPMAGIASNAQPSLFAPNNTVPHVGPPQSFLPHAQMPAMASGDQNLPEGMTLPPGWSLLPLQRMEQFTNIGNTRNFQPSQPHIPQPARPTAFPASPTPSVSQAAVTRSDSSVQPSSSSGLVESNINSTTNEQREHNPGVEEEQLSSSTATTNVTPSSSVDGHHQIEQQVQHSQDQSHHMINGQPECSSGHLTNNAVASSSSAPPWGSANEAPKSLPNDQNDVAASSGIDLALAGANGNAESDPSANDAAERMQRKGKAKAATVEDFIDDVD